MPETTPPLGYKGISQVLAETPLGTILKEASDAAVEVGEEVETARQEVAENRTATYEDRLAAAESRRLTGLDAEATRQDTLAAAESRRLAGISQEAAAGSATTAGTKAGEADTSSKAAQVARTGAETAATSSQQSADLSRAGANLYATTAAGLAAVAEGATFNVVGDTSATYAITYRKVSGAAVEVARYPSKAALDAQAALVELQPNRAEIHTWTDGAGGDVMSLSPDGLWLYGLGFTIESDAGLRRVRFTTRDGVAGIVVDDDLGVDAGTGFARVEPLIEGLAYEDGASGITHGIGPDLAYFAGLVFIRLADGTVECRDQDNGLVFTYANGVFSTGGVSYVAPGVDGKSVILSSPSGRTALRVVDDEGIDLGGAQVRSTVGFDGIGAEDGAGGVTQAFGDGWASFAGLTFEAQADGTAAVYNLDRELIQVIGGGVPAGDVFNADFRAARNAEAERYSNALRARLATSVAGVMSRYGLISSMGQSNSVGAQATPPTPPTRTGMTWRGRKPGGLMIGDSVHGVSGSGGAGWTPFGGTYWSELRSRVRGAGNTLLTDAEVASLPAGASNAGQTILETAVLVFDYLRLRTLGLASDPTHQFPAYAAGTGGKSVAELSKGASPDLYGRMLPPANLAKSLAGSDSIRDLAWLISQGEQDGQNGTTGAAWRAGWNTLRADRHADITRGIFGHGADEPMVPAFVLQTSGRGIVDPTGLPIASAQLDWAEEEEANVFLANDYRLTEHGIHKTSNTTAYAGQRLGILMHRVLTLGQRPFPFAPHQILGNGNRIFLTLRVPQPPIKFVDVYDLFQAVQTTSKGFVPWDAAGDIPVSSVEITNSSSLLITLGRALGASPMLDYGRRVSPLGSGNVADSTSNPLLDYAYDTTSGYRSEDDIPALVGKPYPSEEMLSLFSRPVTMI